MLCAWDDDDVDDVSYFVLDWIFIVQPTQTTFLVQIILMPIQYVFAVTS